MRVPVISLLLVTCLLTGCATMATNPAVPAFSDAVTAGTRAFTAARSAEHEAFMQSALNAALTDGTVATENCWQPGYDPVECQLVVTIDGHRASLGAVASNGAKLAQALAAYAQGLSQLLSAQDLDEQHAALRNLSAGLGQISSLLAIPGVGQVGNLVADIQGAIALKNRRAQVLAIAEQCDGTIAKAADLLQSETRLLQQNIISSASQTIQHVEVMLAIAPPERRLSLVQRLVDAAAMERHVSSVTIDLANPLRAAHSAMIMSLRNPSMDTHAALRKIGSLTSAYQSIESAFSGTVAKPVQENEPHD